MIGAWGQCFRLLLVMRMIRYTNFENILCHSLQPYTVSMLDRTCPRTQHPAARDPLRMASTTVKTPSKHYQRCGKQRPVCSFSCGRIDPIIFRMSRQPRICQKTLPPGRTFSTRCSRKSIAMCSQWTCPSCCSRYVPSANTKCHRAMIDRNGSGERGLHRRIGSQYGHSRS